MGCRGWSLLLILERSRIFHSFQWKINWARLNDEQMGSGWPFSQPENQSIDVFFQTKNLRRTCAERTPEILVCRIALFWPANERLILHSGEEEQKATDVVVAVGRFETNLKNEWIMYTQMVVCMMTLRHVFLVFFGVVFNISSSPWKHRWSKFVWLFYNSVVQLGSTLHWMVYLASRNIWFEPRQKFSAHHLRWPVIPTTNLDPFVCEGTFKNPASPNAISLLKTEHDWLENPPWMKIFQLVMLVFRGLVMGYCTTIVYYRSYFFHLDNGNRRVARKRWEVEFLLQWTLRL